MGPYFAAIFDTIFCAHFWHIVTSIWAPFHGPWVPTLRPFSTQYFAQIFGTSCQPFGHHFMDPMDTLSWTQMSVNVWILGSLTQPHQLPSLFFSSPFDNSCMHQAQETT